MNINSWTKKESVTAETFIQSKIDMIQNEPDYIKEVAGMLVNGEESSDEELEAYINEYFSNQFNVSDMVKEWNEYARMTYIRMQIAKNKNFSSVAMLNGTIFVNSFVEKFLK